MLEWNASLQHTVTALDCAVAEIDGEPVFLTVTGYLDRHQLFPGSRFGVIVKPKGWKAKFERMAKDAAFRREARAKRLAKKRAKG